MQSTVTNTIDAVDIQWQLTCTRFDEWINNDLFHYRWWVLLALFILCEYLWWKTVDKSRLNEIILYAAFVTIMILALDELGTELTLWYYPINIFPLFPPIAAIDLSCLPLVYSLIYQYFRTWKSFIIASIIMSIISCFVLEPIFVWSGIYKMITWKSYYGLPIYFSIALCAKCAVVKIYSIESKK
jgi:hypothetical protein